MACSEDFSISASEGASAVGSSSFFSSEEEASDFSDSESWQSARGTGQDYASRRGELMESEPCSPRWPSRGRGRHQRPGRMRHQLLGPKWQR